MDKPQVTLVIEDHVFKVRKSLLCEFSDYFRAMFSGNYVEKEQKEIAIDVVDARSMNLIIQYMELGMIDLSEYHLQTVGDLAVAANFLQITELVKQIDYCLEEQLTLTNWLDIRAIGQNASSAKLELSAVIYGLSSFPSMRPEYIPTIQKLFWYLSHPYLNTDSEYQVFKFGLNCIEHFEMGADTLLILLCCLDMNKLSTADLQGIKFLIRHYVNSLTEKVVDCMYKLSTDFELSVTGVLENKPYLCELFTEKVYNEVLSFMRASIERKLEFIPVVPMWANKDVKPEISPNYLFSYTEEFGFQKWLEVTEKNLWGWKITSWSPTKLVVVCGEHGRGTGSFMREVKVYDIQKREWIRHGVQLPPRRHGGVTILGDSLFIVGGVGAFRLHTQQAESMIQILYNSLNSTQPPQKDNHFSGLYSFVPKQSLAASEFRKKYIYRAWGTYVARSTSDAEALVSVERNGRKKTILHNMVTYLIKKCSEYWRTLKGGVKVGSSSQKADTMEPVSFIQGIDMNPAKPKRKENPDVPEIPEPGVPEVPLPGFPVPGFPDVAVPIVPELPLPELPEIPAPEKPKDPRKGIPLPGQPVPIFPDIFFPRSPAIVLPEVSIPEPSPMTLYNQLSLKAMDHIKLNPNIKTACIHQKSQILGVCIPAISNAIMTRNYFIYILRSNQSKTV